jgi:hypothetical protein
LLRTSSFHMLPSSSWMLPSSSWMLPSSSCSQCKHPHLSPLQRAHPLAARPGSCCGPAPAPPPAFAARSFQCSLASERRLFCGRRPNTSFQELLLLLLLQAALQWARAQLCPCLSTWVAAAGGMPLRGGLLGLQLLERLCSGSSATACTATRVQGAGVGGQQCASATGSQALLPFWAAETWAWLVGGTDLFPQPASSNRCPPVLLLP